MITTSADGNLRVTQLDTTGAGAFNVTVTHVRVLNADGSVTETSTVTNADGSLKRKTIATTGSDERDISLSRDIDGDGIVDQVVTTSNNGLVTTESDYNSNGTLKDKSVVTTSADGLSVTTQRDIDGSGTLDQTRTDVTVLNVNGSRTETISDFNAGLALVGKTVITTGADGLSTTTQSDVNGDGAVDSSRTDVTVLNADGSRTETVQGFNGAGQPTSSRSQTISANGLSSWTQWALVGGGQSNQLLTDVTVLNADGSRAETITAAQQSRTVITTSADGRTTTVVSDTSGDGVVDQSQTTVSTANADGSQTQLVTDYNADGSVRDSAVTTTAPMVARWLSHAMPMATAPLTRPRSTLPPLMRKSKPSPISTRRELPRQDDRDDERRRLTKTTRWDFISNGTINRRRTDLTVRISTEYDGRSRTGTQA